MQVDKRAEKVAANMSYTGLIYKLVEQFDDLSETHKSYVRGRMPFRILESHFINVLAEMYVYILAFTRCLTEEETRKWDDIVEYRLSLHEKSYDKMHKAGEQ